MVTKKFAGRMYIKNMLVKPTDPGHMLECRLAAVRLLSLIDGANIGGLDGLERCASIIYRERLFPELLTTSADAHMFLCFAIRRSAVKARAGGRWTTLWVTAGVTRKVINVLSDTLFDEAVYGKLAS